MCACMLSLCNVLCSWMTINHDVSPPLRLAPFTSVCPLIWHKCISPLGWIVTFRIILRPSRELLILLKGKSGETRCWHDVTLHPKLEARYNTVVKVILTDWMYNDVSLYLLHCITATTNSDNHCFIFLLVSHYIQNPVQDMCGCL